MRDRQEYHRGHKVQGDWVSAGFEKFDKSKLFMFVIKNRTRDELLPLIKKWIKPRSVIYSYCWKPYDTLRQKGYTHLKVNHSRNCCQHQPHWEWVEACQASTTFIWYSPCPCTVIPGPAFMEEDVFGSGPLQVISQHCGTDVWPQHLECTRAAVKSCTSLLTSTGPY